VKYKLAIMRVVALVLTLAVGPVGPTLCTVRCAEAPAHHATAGMSAGAGPQMDDMSSHDMSSMSTDAEDAAAAPGRCVTAPGAFACSHFGRVEPSIPRSVDTPSSSTATVLPTALRVDLRVTTTLQAIAPTSASPPPHAPLLVPLRI
jgi:hypothetical protein